MLRNEKNFKTQAPAGTSLFVSEKYPAQLCGSDPQVGGNMMLF